MVKGQVASCKLTDFLAGQVLAGLVISQYGWLGSPIRPINAWNALGMLFLIAGAVLTEIGH